MEDLQKVLQRVAKSGEPPRQGVNPIGSEGDYPSRVGVGSRKDSTQTSDSQNPSLINQVWVEAASTYSYIIVTENGAFEVPPNWPTDGTYAVSGQTYITLPDVLTESGSVYVLDTTASTYIQRRVHATFFKHRTKNELMTHYYHVQIEQPYNKKAYIVGTNIYGMGFSSNPFSEVGSTPTTSPLTPGRDVKTYLAVNPFLKSDPLVSKLLEEFAQAGIIEEA